MRAWSCAALAVTLAACGSGATSGSHTAGGKHAAAAAAAPPSTTAPPTTLPPTTTMPPDPGSLPQTRDLPTAGGPMFDAGVQGLWQAIVADNPALATPFFFPLNAYIQVKAISDPSDDWHNRLVAAYDRDIHTLHERLGNDAAGAQFLGIDVPQGRAEWITPGVEYNKGSYWRVYGTTVRYSVDGRSGSFPVMSLISWRGEWYVVHLSEIS